MSNFKSGKQSIYGIKFDISDLSQFVDIVRFVHGDSSRWIYILDNVSTNPGLLKSMILMVRIGLYYGLIHIRLLLTAFFPKIT